jgi:polyvinyl alcohol dehydrogenase (cytochrome)
LFTRACATCHKPGQTAVPPPEALRDYTPAAVLNALTNGKMAIQGATLTTAERVAVAEFVTGRALAASTRRANQCTAATPDDRSDARAALDGVGWRCHQHRYAAQGGLARRICRASS